MTNPHNHLYQYLSDERVEAFSSNPGWGAFTHSAMTLTLTSEDGQHQQTVTMDHEIALPSANRVLEHLLEKEGWVEEDDPTGLHPAVAQRIPASSDPSITDEMLHTLSNHINRALVFYNTTQQIHRLVFAMHSVLAETLLAADLVPSERIDALIEYLETPDEARESIFADFTLEQTVALLARIQACLHEARLPFSPEDLHELKHTLFHRFEIFKAENPITAMVYISGASYHQANTDDPLDRLTMGEHMVAFNETHKATKPAQNDAAGEFTEDVHTENALSALEKLLRTMGIDRDLGPKKDKD